MADIQVVSSQGTTDLILWQPIVRPGARVAFYAAAPGPPPLGRSRSNVPGSLVFRAVGAADVPALFHVRTRTRENTLTSEELEKLGITPPSVEHRLATTCKGWLCADADRVVGFCMADQANGELWVIAILPEYEGRGIGGRLMALAEDWLWASGCTRAWLTTDVDTSLRAYGFYRHRGWSDWKVEGGLRWMELHAPEQPAVRS
jgi:GNAT superfamily N-acetyltransferase